MGNEEPGTRMEQSGGRSLHLVRALFAFERTCSFTVSEMEAIEGLLPEEWHGLTWIKDHFGCYTEKRQLGHTGEAGRPVRMLF